MKSIRFMVSALLAVTFSLSVVAQATKTATNSTSKTETFKVSGNCDMCKTRIEKAAKIEGVTKAEWDKQKKMLTLSYIPSTVSADQVQKKIAAAGHDTGNYRADDKVYNSLPACCKYR